MGEFLTRNAFPDPLVHTNSFSMNSVGSVVTRSGSVASTAWPSSNLALFIPFRITRTTLLSSMFAMNGATASGNIDLGVYSWDGAKLVSAGSTAQSGTAGLQVISVTSTELAPGLYYMAVAMDNTTGTLYGQPLSTAPLLSFLGMAQMASAFPLPSTAIFASMSNTLIPLMGFTNRSFV